jgi:two-component system, chemotaxis family, chemotaxis protein CheY
MHHTVIIADDAQFMRVLLKDILEEIGVKTVAEASDGDTACTLYREHRPTLVMLDITMPGCGGVEACRRILGEDPAARVIMISALGQKEEVLAAIRAGAGDFVIKPFEAERVEETVQSILERQPQPL